MRVRLHIVFPLSLVVLLSCMKKPDFPTSVWEGYMPTGGDSTYVEIFPPWSGFQQPWALLVGQDQLFYVADYGGNEIIMMNAAGHVLGRRTVLRPHSLGQDTRLDLLVGGEIVRPNGDTLGAVLRFHIVKDRQNNFYGHQRFATVPVETVWTEPARPNRRYVGIAVFPDNQYLVARTGPNNASFVDPDSRVLWFTKGDTLVTPLGDLVTRAGSGITDINRLTGIAAFPGRRDFIVTQSSEGITYGAIWMVYHFTPDFQGWLPRFDPSKPEDRFVDFVRPSRYLLPSAVAFDRRRGDIFIVDAELDSVSKFTSRGRFRPESFGDALATVPGVFPEGFKGPRGIAFHERTLYVVDTGNRVIRLFRLATDLF